MADEDEQFDEDLNLDGDYGVDSGKSGGKKKILFIVLPLLLLAGVGAGLYFSGMFGGGEEEQAKTEMPVKKAPKQTVFYDLPDMLVNINSTGTRPLFLKLKVSLEIEDEGQRAELERLRPRILNKFQIYLRELRLEDPRGKKEISRLREVLLAEINAVAHPAQVENVLFKDFLIQ